MHIRFTFTISFCLVTLAACDPELTGDAEELSGVGFSGPTGLALPPADAIVSEICGPDGAPAVEIRLEVAEPQCAAEPDASELRIVLFDTGPLVPATYALGWDDGFVVVDGTPVFGSELGQVTITSWDDERVAGKYALDLGDGALAGRFAGPACPRVQACD